MSNKLYEGINHTFYSNNSSDGIITLRPKTGQTLRIDGTLTSSPVAADPESSVQFNSSGLLDGSSSFTYNSEGGILSVPVIDCEYYVDTARVKKVVESDSLGFSQIYSATKNPSYFPQNYTSVLPGFASADIQLSSDNRIIVACPNYVSGASTGSISVLFDDIMGYDQEASLDVTSYTLEKTLNTCSIYTSEGVEVLCYMDNAENVSRLYVCKGDSGAWISTDVQSTANNSHCTCSIGYYKPSTGILDIIVKSFDSSHSVLEVWTYDVNNEVLSPSFTQFYDFGAEIDNVVRAVSPTGLAAYYNSSNSLIKIFAKHIITGAWFEVYSSSVAGVTDMSIFVNDDLSITNFTYVHNGNLSIVYTDDTLVSVVGNFTLCSCNVNYVFVYNSDGEIEIHHRTGSSTWTKSLNNYPIANVISMKCNQNFLVCGLSSGSINIFQIQSYSNSDVTLNQIILDTNTMKVENLFDATINKNLDVGSLSIDNDAIKFTATVNPDQLNVFVEDVKKMEIASTHIHSLVPHRFLMGSETVPSIVFAGDTDTGIYSNGDSTISFTSNGARSMAVVAQGPLVNVGSAAAPSVSFLFDPNTGMYSPAADTLAFSTGGTKRMGMSTSRITDSLPMTTVVGSAAAPSITFTGDTSTGIYAGSAGETTFASAGVRKVMLNSSGVNTDKILSLTTSTTTLDMNSGIQLGISGVYAGKFGSSGTNLTEVSFGNNCSLASENSTGSVLKVSCVTANRWNLELSVATGAFIFAAFRASTNPVGSITTNGSTTAYNTSSDYRMKEEIVDMDSQLDKISSLRPVKYRWKRTGTLGEGFVAHELAEIFPDAVTGKKDEVDENGDIVPQQIDTSFLIGSLVKSIQELRAEIELLKTKIL